MSYPMDADEAIQSLVYSLAHQPTPDPFKSLAIFGNGLDLSCGVKSSFQDFRKFFAARLTTLNPERDDRVFFHLFEQLDSIAGPEWQDFELGLSGIALPLGVADSEGPDEGDLSEWDSWTSDGTAHADDLRTCLSELFHEWIEVMPVEGTGPTSPHAKRLSSLSNGIITFNYTPTLQRIWQLTPSKILHIHGRMDHQLPLYFGCPTYEGTISASGSNSQSQTIREGVHRELISSLTKRPRLDLMDVFFEHCNDLITVGSYGFSFGKADLPYIEYIVSSYCDRSTIWTHYCHSPSSPTHQSDDATRCSEALKAVNFQGEIRYLPA